MSEWDCGDGPVQFKKILEAGINYCGKKEEREEKVPSHIASE